MHPFSSRHGTLSPDSTDTVADILFAELERRGLSTSSEEGSVSLFSQSQGCQ